MIVNMNIYYSIFQRPYTEREVEVKAKQVKMKNERHD
jgi:hypothetical protein